ncbi:MAG TPA: hypothetical protein VNT32_05660, partial [Thermoleophilaceae bacterium]|nr:hypothetical protein [Thermoleophilaceae bacterium]
MGFAAIPRTLAAAAAAAAVLLGGAGDAFAARVTHQFPAAAAERVFVVPPGVTSIDVRAVGGRGGAGAAPGGLG